MKTKTLNLENLSGRILGRSELKSIVGGSSSMSFLGLCRWRCVDPEDPNFEYGSDDGTCNTVADCPSPGAFPPELVCVRWCG